ncbi:hypothetical protein BCR34DRAFT_583914 [Clohesyomyces aquaticus]|uniref:Uncharacterized protein n=1 Tax=Clohesyomyces aquaticus TaxID=1231657 RepID=A0A1Y2A3V4_9PLEO|nr:hypothetical protein BCR34DRAFT_583914 [Clohesyomyces aquaticus]
MHLYPKATRPRLCRSISDAYIGHNSGDMPLDPITATGLAANIFQFLSFGHKIVSGATAIYASSHGAAVSISDKEDVTKHLLSQVESLQHPLLASGAQIALTKNEQNLETLRQKCVDVGGDLIGMLGEVTIQGSTTKWKSLKVALRTVYSENMVSEVEQRLRVYQDALQRQVIVDLKLASSQQSASLDHLNDGIMSLSRSLSETAFEVSTASNRQIQVSRSLQQQTERFITSQHDQTRAEIEALSTMLARNIDVNQNMASLLEMVGRLVTKEPLVGINPTHSMTAISHFDHTEAVQDQRVFLERLYRNRSLPLSSRGAPRYIQGPLDNRFHSITDCSRFILGLNYGTTYTQVAHAFKQPAYESPGIYLTETRRRPLQTVGVGLVENWPGGQGNVDLPSRIAYASENHDLSEDLIGYEVTPDTMSYSHTKPLLCSPGVAELLSNVDASNIETAGALKLPKGKSATKVVGDYLRIVRKHALGKLKENWGPMMESTPLEVWATVPAMWSDEAKVDFKRAMEFAGFGSSHRETISFIKEPEAATLAAFRGSGDPSTFESEDIILVCDCGSTSTDVTVYTIQRTSPSLQLEECVDGMEQRVGILSVILNFTAWMHKEFGPAFSALPKSLTGPGTRFMKCFERLVTFEFRGEAPSQFGKYAIPLWMNVPDSEHYKNGKGILLTELELISFYEPVAEKIINAVDRQSERAKKQLRVGKKIRIIVVGALSDSPYLQNALRRWKQSQADIQLMIPSRSRASSAIGAVLRGLQDNPIVSSRISKQHFGVVIGQKFLSDKDEPSALYYHPWDLSQMCNNRTTWLIKRDGYIDETTHIIVPLWRDFRDDDLLNVEISLVGSPLPEAPETYPNKDVELIATISSNIGRVAELGSFETKERSNGTRIWRAAFNFHISPARTSMSFGLIGRLTDGNGMEYGRIDVPI